MRDFMCVLRVTADSMWRLEEEMLASDPDDEIFHLQADGFYGPERGFHDAEQLRKQLEERGQRN
jgi:hypothetical protein